MGNNSAFSCISLTDLYNTRNNCEYLMSRANLPPDTYEKINVFHSDIIREIDRRLKHG